MRGVDKLKNKNNALENIYFAKEEGFATFRSKCLLWATSKMYAAGLAAPNF